jgi:surfactin synthase thioesterase subunit
MFPNASDNSHHLRVVRRPPGQGAAAGWRPCRRPDPLAGARLFCFPHAGGGSTAFASWGEALPSVEVCPVELPGRLTRLREPPIERMDTLAELLAGEIAPLLDRPYALFGHSLGGLVAFEVARRLRAEGAPQPSALVVAATPPPHLRRPDRRLHECSDAELVAELRALGGTPAEVLADPGLLRLLLPIVRADLAVMETYEHRSEHPLACAVFAVGAEDDRLAPPSCLSGWGRHTTAGASVAVLPGGHFFLQRDPGPLLAILRAGLREEAHQAPLAPAT